MIQHTPCSVKAKSETLGDAAALWCKLMRSKRVCNANALAERDHSSSTDGIIVRQVKQLSDVLTTAGCFIDRTVIPTVSLQ